MELEGRESLAAGFRTLPKDPEQLRLLTLSDSHAFATRESFDRAVWAHRPDCILHSGDIVEGTGAQAEQFAYFLRVRDKKDFIHWFPVLYAEGNHDQGGPYFDAYIYEVQVVYLCEQPSSEAVSRASRVQAPRIVRDVWLSFFILMFLPLCDFPGCGNTMPHPRRDIHSSRATKNLYHF